MWSRQMHRSKQLEMSLLCTLSPLCRMTAQAKDLTPCILTGCRCIPFEHLESRYR